MSVCTDTKKLAQHQGANQIYRGANRFLLWLSLVILEKRRVQTQAAELVEEILRDNLRGLFRTAARAHPNVTLSILVVGLVHYCEQRERREQHDPRGFSRKPVLRLIDSLGVSLVFLFSYPTPSREAASWAILQSSRHGYHKELVPKSEGPDRL